MICKKKKRTCDIKWFWISLFFCNKALIVSFKCPLCFVFCIKTDKRVGQIESFDFGYMSRGRSKHNKMETFLFQTLLSSVCDTKDLVQSIWFVQSSQTWCLHEIRKFVGSVSSICLSFKCLVIVTKPTVSSSVGLYPALRLFADGACQPRAVIYCFHLATDLVHLLKRFEW